GKLVAAFTGANPGGAERRYGRLTGCVANTIPAWSDPGPDSVRDPSGQTDPVTGRGDAEPNADDANARQAYAYTNHDAGLASNRDPNPRTDADADAHPRANAACYAITVPRADADGDPQAGADGNPKTDAVASPDGTADADIRRALVRVGRVTGRSLPAAHSRIARCPGADVFEFDRGVASADGVR
ncbi:MAG: hypothetical protein ACREM8_03995, partial [Vulcanimicrobiaceae bacterium]